MKEGGKKRKIKKGGGGGIDHNYDRHDDKCKSDNYDSNIDNELL